MTKKQQLLIDLRDIEIDTIKKEKNFDFRTALIKTFKAVYRLFESEQDISKKDIVSAAERESKRSGLEGRYDWNKIFDLKEEVVRNVEKSDNVKQNTTLSNGNSYPDNFYARQAIANGSCFFDSFRQGLEQQKGVKVTVEQLRMNCLEYAFDNTNKEGWFKNAIANSYDNNDQRRSETVDLYVANILDNNRWGDPDVEGRILCEKYGVQLHVVENNPLKAIDNQQDPFLHQLIDHRGSKSAGEYNKVDYNDSSVLHMINKGGAHFEPLLDRKKDLTNQPQKLQQEQENHKLAEVLQAREISSFMLNAFQEHSSKLSAKQPQEQTQEQKDFLLARQLQEKEDILYAKQLQEKEDYLLAKQLQGQEYGYVRAQASQVKSDELLAVKLQREEYTKHRQGQKSFSPGCGMQKVRLTHQTPQLVK